MYHNCVGNGTGNQLDFPRFWKDTVVHERNLPDEGEQKARLRLRLRLRLRGNISRGSKEVTLRGIVAQIPGANIKEFLAIILNEPRRVIQVKTGLSLNLQPLTSTC